jgi:hypothetical protein
MSLRALSDTDLLAAICDELLAAHSLSSLRTSQATSLEIWALITGSSLTAVVCHFSEFGRTAPLSEVLCAKQFTWVWALLKKGSKRHAEKPG